jgi:TM2 domain-containing membrane protein YozV
VYCEDCLAEVVSGKSPTSGTPQTKPAVVAGSSPGVAFALGLIPGVGAIYNGEFVKAAVHLLIFGILTSLNRVALQPLIGMFVFGFIVYMPFEAYYTAKKRQLRAEGIELETPIDRLQQQFGGMEDKHLWGGIALIIVGALFLLGNLDLFDLSRVGRMLWPVILIALGVWWLRKKP